MKIKLLIASGDSDYAEHLSCNLSERHSDVIDVVVCRTPDRLRDVLGDRKFDVALLEASFIEDADIAMISLPLLLWADEETAGEAAAGLLRIRKYQRISSLVANILEHYAKISTDLHGCDSGKAVITAVWAPAGGVGKTTVALSYAARKASEKKQVLYLNLEPFSSVCAYFTGTGKSVSAVFEMIESREGDVRMLIRGIRRQECEDGIAYFCPPDNFDDVNILTTENISALIGACAGVTDELIVDMSCVCDERTRKAFELADRVLIVTDPTSTAQIKLSQFLSQSDVIDRIRDKATIVANKGASLRESVIDAIVRLPLVQSTDATAIYKALSMSFEA